jgi:hypothetical protein
MQYSLMTIETKNGENGVDILIEFGHYMSKL